MADRDCRTAKRPKSETAEVRNGRSPKRPNSETAELRDCEAAKLRKLPKAETDEG